MILYVRTSIDYDAFLITVANGQRVIDNAHIGDQVDRDLSTDKPYVYSTFELTGDRAFVIFHRMIRVVEGETEKDSLVSKDLWTILDNGKLVTNRN